MLRLNMARDYECTTVRGKLFVKCPWQESNPWGSVLRVICVTIRSSIVQPRLYDSLMVTQITLDQRRRLPSDSSLASSVGSWRPLHHAQPSGRANLPSSLLQVVKTKGSTNIVPQYSRWRTTKNTETEESR